MSLTLQEQETVILFNEAEKTAGVYTHNRPACESWKSSHQDSNLG